MAEIPKVASTFKAARLKVGVCVSLEKWNELENKLEAIGLEPKVFLIGGTRIWFKVVVPLSYNPLPPHIPKAILDIVWEFDKHPEGLGSGETIDLLCPPASPKIYGICPHCSNQYHIVVEEKTGILVMSDHNLIGTKSKCEGSGEKPQSETLWQDRY